MNNLDHIYQELGENICLFPFFGAFYQTHNISLNDKSAPNTLRPCSLIRNNKKNWKVDNDNISETRNNQRWIDLRKNFIKGSCHTNPDCATCSIAEKVNGDSPRKLNNQYFAEHLSIDIVKEVKEIIDNDYQVSKILSLDFFPSSYCNYACIMCNGGASSARWTFERSIDNEIRFTPKIVNNQINQDFYKVLDNVEIINFTGGETIMQKQVYELIDYLIEKGIAKNITISLLTNASDYPTKLVEKFKKFKNIFYTTSIDGIGSVIEYQRRGADWDNVEDTALKLQQAYGSTINYVLTAVNVFSLLEWIDWLQKHNINDRIFISVVFNNDCLSTAVIPPELKTVLIDKLQAGKNNYSQAIYKDIINRVLGILSDVEYKPELLSQFISKIKIEDSASKKSLVEVVPEWKPYFE